MIKYLHKVIETFPEALQGTKALSARYHLFTVREDGEIKFLPEEQARQLHRTVANLLFLCKRALSRYRAVDIVPRDQSEGAGRG